MSSSRKKILFLVTEDWYFCSHRLPLAIAAREAGYDVCVATRVQAHGDRIRGAGLTLLPISMRRRSKNPFSELKAIFELVNIYRREKPDVVHHVALKPVLYGSIAAWLVNVAVSVNAIAGLGFVFSSQSKRAELLQPVIRTLFRWLLNRDQSYVILQNPDDAQMLVEAGILGRDRVVLIRGSGVDLQQFNFEPEPISGNRPVVMLVSRMLWDKGVGEFVAAAKILQNSGVRADFVLVGEGDSDNPACISTAHLEQWRDEGVVEWWGRLGDISEVLGQANIVCLPSYREGLPKVLLEAASKGRAIVATDVPGCREVVRQGENGVLVPARDPEALAKAIENLIKNVELRESMGKRGRKIAEAEFSVDKVVDQTLALYQELLN